MASTFPSHTSALCICWTTFVSSVLSSLLMLPLLFGKLISSILIQSLPFKRLFIHQQINKIAKQIECDTFSTGGGVEDDDKVTTTKKKKSNNKEDKERRGELRLFGFEFGC